MTTPLWQQEFPDYPVDQFPSPIPAGWVDESWHNNVCPSFIATEADGRALTVWIDYPDPAQREFPDSRRFSVSVHDEDGDDCVNALESDDWDGFLADALALAATFGRGANA